MKKLAAPNKDVLVDLLRERLASARIAVALYDRILEHHDGRALPERAEVFEALAGLRAQEEEHIAFLDAALGELGESSLAIPGRHLRGFEEVARASDARIVELVSALWALECAQDGAWDLLLRLARGAEDAPAILVLERRAREEHAHAVLVRDIVHTVLRDRLGQVAGRLAA